jgi:hypothetical protein
MLRGQINIENWLEHKAKVKLRCDERFTHAFTARSFVFKEITLVGSNQGNYFENANACNKHTLKTKVTTQHYIANFACPIPRKPSQLVGWFVFQPR